MFYNTVNEIMESQHYKELLIRVNTQKDKRFVKEIL